MNKKAIIAIMAALTLSGYTLLKTPTSLDEEMTNDVGMRRNDR